MDKSKNYLPKERAWYHPTNEDVNKFNKGEKVQLPNPTIDDITVNNIAWQEFDYTENFTDDKI